MDQSSAVLCMCESFRVLMVEGLSPDLTAGGGTLLLDGGISLWQHPLLIEPQSPLVSITTEKVSSVY